MSNAFYLVPGLCLGTQWRAGSACRRYFLSSLIRGRASIVPARRDSQAEPGNEWRDTHTRQSIRRRDVSDGHLSQIESCRKSISLAAAQPTSHAATALSDDPSRTNFAARSEGAADRGNLFPPRQPSSHAALRPEPSKAAEELFSPLPAAGEGSGVRGRASPRSHLQPNPSPVVPFAALTFRRKIRSNGLDHTLHAFDDAPSGSLAEAAIGFRSGLYSIH
jgi:hypothetical protein